MIFACPMRFLYDRGLLEKLLGALDMGDTEGLILVEHNGASGKIPSVGELM